MRRWRSAAGIVLATVLIAAAGCAPTDPVVPEPEPEPETPAYLEVIRDNHFARGFGVRGETTATGTQVFKVLDYQGTAEQPHVWDMARWNNPEGFDSPTSTEEKIGDEYVYTDSSKVVRVNPETGYLYTELDTSKIYDHPRVYGEPWPHLLIEQDFESIDITRAEKIMASISFRIVRCDNLMGDAYNSNIHTGHFLWYFTLRNEVPEGATFEEAGRNGDFLWYGVPLYDYRTPNGMAESAVIDGGVEGAGNGKLIYSMPTTDYLPPIEIGTLYQVEVDILPYMRRAYERAQEMKMLENVRFENLRFSYMNLGWEVPGTFHVASEFTDLSVKVYLKDGESV